MKKIQVLWLIALLVVNTGWYVVSQQSATQEINRPGADFSDNREAEINSLLGEDADFQIEYCFESINGGIYNVSIEVQQDSKTIHSWNGTTDDQCMEYKSSAKKGEIVILTQIEDGVEVTTNLLTWPLSNALVPGIVLFTIGTVALAFGESFIRKLIKKKLDSQSLESLPEPAPSETIQTGIWQEPVRPK